MKSAKLKGAIFGHGKTISEVAEALDLSYSAFYRRLYGEMEFSRAEINRLTDFLGLSVEEMMDIFFDSKVS